MTRDPSALAFGFVLISVGLAVAATSSRLTALRNKFGPDGPGGNGEGPPLLGLMVVVVGFATALIGMLALVL